MSASWQALWPAPAKLNLFLHVVGRRDDGYHLLQTAFQFIDHCDFLRFAPAPAGEVVLETPLPGVPPESDLTVRAARLLLEASGTAQGVRIAIEKRLPMGGGLGGGSSDAATTLIALNRLWGLGLSAVDLQQLGLRLGADVPVFIHGHNCFAEGVGERFTDLTLPETWYLVVTPAVAVPTAEVFRDPGLRRDTPAMAPGDWQPGIGSNDLEAVACRLYPAVAECLETLRASGREARMSGSGACCFSNFDSLAEARAAQAALPPQWSAFVARGLSRHPLAAD